MTDQKIPQIPLEREVQTGSVSTLNYARVTKKPKPSLAKRVLLYGTITATLIGTGLIAAAKCYSENMDVSSFVYPG